MLFHFDIVRLLKFNYGMSCLCATACTGKRPCHDDLQTCVLREGALNAAPQQKCEWDYRALETCSLFMWADSARGALNFDATSGSSSLPPWAILVRNLKKQSDLSNFGSSFLFGLGFVLSKLFCNKNGLALDFT